MSEIREWSEKARRCSWNIDEDGGDKRAEGEREQGTRS